MEIENAYYVGRGRYVAGQSLTDRLEDQGFHVDEADRGEDALELTDIYEYQVMILDLGLPDMSGDEVLDN